MSNRRSAVRRQSYSDDEWLCLHPLGAIYRDAAFDKLLDAAVERRVWQLLRREREEPNAEANARSAIDRHRRLVEASRKSDAAAREYGFRLP